jgi:thiol-disulfide isomerase/thioredoxin
MVWSVLRNGLLAALALAACVTAGASAADRETGKPGVKDFALLDPKGGRHTPAEWRDRKAVVLIFLGTECPVSNGYAPTVVRLAKAYAPKGVAVYGVYPDPDVSAADAVKHADEYKLSAVARELTFLLDPHQVLPAQTGVTRVPEAVVLTPAGIVRYRGRIDDKYSLDGRRREEPKAKDLENAIEAVLAGKAPEPAETKAFGCPLPPPAKPAP